METVMIDKKTEENIKNIDTFLESWGKFRQLYDEITAKSIVTKEDEALFSETQAIISKKYEDLKGNLEFKYMPYGRLTDPITEMLSLENVSNMSEERSGKIKKDWDDSYIFLNNILERLKNRKRRLEHFSDAGVWAKRLFERIGGRKND